MERQWSKLGIWRSSEWGAWHSKSTNEATRDGGNELRSDNRLFSACDTSRLIVSWIPVAYMCCSSILSECKNYRPLLTERFDHLREFPSLSSAPQAQFHNPSQAVWANANQRAVQHTPVQRPQQQHPINQQSNNQQQQHDPSAQEGQQGAGDLFPSNSQFQTSLDDYRRGAQGGVNQGSGSGHPPTGNIEDFPPLGRSVNEEGGQDRRDSLMQNATFGNFSTANGLNLSQTAGISRTTAPPNQSDARGASTLADRIMSPNAMAFGGTHIVVCIAPCRFNIK